MLKLATELDEYLRQRAAVEGVAYELSASWLARQLAQLCPAMESLNVDIFGVRIEKGQLISDDQEPAPGFFGAWKQSKSSAN